MVEKGHHVTGFYILDEIQRDILTDVDDFSEFKRVWARRHELKVIYLLIRPDASAEKTILTWQAAEKRPSASFLSSLVVAAYVQVCLTTQDFEGSRERDFGTLNLHLGIFEQP
jgi:hypothetical protein